MIRLIDLYKINQKYKRIIEKRSFHKQKSLNDHILNSIVLCRKNKVIQFIDLHTFVLRKV